MCSGRLRRSTYASLLGQSLCQPGSFQSGWSRSFAATAARHAPQCCPVLRKSSRVGPRQPSCQTLIELSPNSSRMPSHGTPDEVAIRF